MRRLDLKKAQTAGLATIRDINRQIVLNYVREREPISRAEIARETELQRSTVSAIVDCLIGEGLVEEIGAGESTGGRRPTLLRLRTAGAIAIGAIVYVTTGKVRQRQDVISGGSYASQNDLTLHFGLGAATSVDKVEVKWPDGSSETVNIPGIDRKLTVIEGKGVVK